jgi:hypothetical protein
MNFNPEVTLGNLLTVSSCLILVVSAFNGLKGKLDVVAALMREHNSRVERMEMRHEQRLTKLEENDARLTTMVQQLIGQNEERLRWDGGERRHGSEPRRR